MGQFLTESHNCMKGKICAEYHQEGIDPPLGQIWLNIVPNGERP